MDLNTFVSTYNGTVVGDGQCVALIKLYEDEVLGFIEYFGLQYAYMYFTEYPNNQGLQNHYDRYTLSDGFPSPGDIVVYNSNTGGRSRTRKYCLSKCKFIWFYRIRPKLVNSW